MCRPSTRLSLPALLFWAVSISSIAPIVTGRDFRYGQFLHADAGGPYEIVDWDDDGSEYVNLDASKSMAAPGVPKISNYIWTYSLKGDSAGPESASPKLSMRLTPGIFWLRLTVKNEWNHSATADTYVVLREPLSEEMKPPEVTSISPESGPLSGGYSVRIFGNRFHHNPTVYFGEQRAHSRVVSDTEILAISPYPGFSYTSTFVENVTVNSGFGNGTDYVQYTYDSNFEVPVNFTYSEVKMKASNGSVVHFSHKFITSVKIGPDGMYYMGSQDGYLFKFSLDYQTHLVTRICNSTQIGSGRVVLGINFHPHEWNTPRLYVSSNLLKWKRYGSGDWKNGRVEVWDSVPTEQCMSFSHTAVSGLPVSNQLHGVEAIEFMNNGDMLISVAGTTNAGVNRPGDELGNIPESPLSGAIIRAKLSFGQNFDGRVEYNETVDLNSTSVLIGNDGRENVQVYASGLRNVFAMVRHSNGKLYGLDNGPNIQSGWIATGCGDTIEVHAEYIDKLLLIKEGEHYGHPNWNRGTDDARQCKYIRRNSTYNPTNNSSESFGVEPGNDIDLETKRPLIYLESAVNGIIEYTADRFRGKLRRDLIISKFNWQESNLLIKATLAGDGETLKSKPEKLLGKSSLSLVMGTQGHIILPRYSLYTIGLYTPVETAHEAVRIIAITPRRGPLDGGNSIYIYGNGFLFAGFKIYFNETEECTQYHDITENSVWCQVPPGILNNAGSQVVPVVAKIGTGHTSKPNDYEYMTY